MLFRSKPHTPFQWCAQIEPELAIQKIYAIKDAFRNNPKVKITYHAPFLSWLEGMIARGDERVGEILLQAFQMGARFDAWDDKFRKDIWKELVENNKAVIHRLLEQRQVADVLPWDGISLGVSRKYFEREFERSKRAILTSACAENCTAPCGACTDSLQIIEKSPIAETAMPSLSTIEMPIIPTQVQNRFRLFFNFSRKDAAAYYAHHGVWEMLATAITRAGIPILQSEGFNPSPRLEISEPLPLGFSSDDENGTVLISRLPDNLSDLPEAINAFLPLGIRIISVQQVQGFTGIKFPSLSSVHWGSSFLISGPYMKSHALEICNQLEACIANRIELSSASLNLENDKASIQILLPFTGKRELGLSSLFEAATGMTIRSSAVYVQRLAQYAKASDGNPVSYAHFYGIE